MQKPSLDDVKEETQQEEIKAKEATLEPVYEDEQQQTIANEAEVVR